MDKYVLIKVTMLFNPADAWQHVHQFDKSFASYLDSIGLVAQEVVTQGGAAGEKIILVKKKPVLVEIPKQDEKGPQQVLTQMKEKKDSQKVKEFKQGKLIIRKGYLRK